ncbi:MAG: acyl-CoA reductase [Bacteroidota bacterium]|nr:acyl-CoA reductase [Bacteroidota bacterium]
MQHIKASLIKLGDFLGSTKNAQLEQVIEKAYIENKWFTPEFIRHNLNYWAGKLTDETLSTWLNEYPELANKNKTVGIVMAGNIPLVGMHDMISVLLSGHKALIKTSSKDNILVKFVVDFLSDDEPSLKQKIYITDDFFTNVDAVIATGSNNTARYFDYYFKNIPHIIRKNRNGIAIMDGTESNEQLQRLARDVFLYFGLGCRNVSKLYIPQDMDEKRILDNMEAFRYFTEHNKYMNNHLYNKAILLMDQQAFLDNDFLILREHTDIASPVAVLYYERYHDVKSLFSQLKKNEDNIQCIATENIAIDNAVKFGETQHPDIITYADDIDTMKFLLHL